ncbi:MAG: hypothetical protein Q8P67_27065 [archaeon]|nr:hypothetical protein [archaeon]
MLAINAAKGWAILLDDATPEMQQALVTSVIHLQIWPSVSDGDDAGGRPA